MILAPREDHHIVVGAFDARGAEDLESTGAHLADQFFFAVFIKVIRGVVARAESPGRRCDEEGAILREAAMDLSERPHRVSQMLDDIEEKRCAKGPVFEGHLLGDSVHAGHRRLELRGLDRGARAGDCFRLRIERDGMDTMPCKKSSKESIACADIEYGLRSRRHIGGEKGDECVGAAAVGVVARVEIPVIRAARIVLFKRDGCTPNACVPAKACQRGIVQERVKIAGIRRETEVRTKVCARELAGKAELFQQQFAAGIFDDRRARHGHDSARLATTDFKRKCHRGERAVARAGIEQRLAARDGKRFATDDEHARVEAVDFAIETLRIARSTATVTNESLGVNDKRAMRSDFVSPSGRGAQSARSRDRQTVVTQERCFELHRDAARLRHWHRDIVHQSAS